MKGPDAIDRAACVLVALGAIPVLFLLGAIGFVVASILGVV